MNIVSLIASRPNRLSRIRCARQNASISVSSSSMALIYATDISVESRSSDGYIRKLRRAVATCDSNAVSAAHYDLERVKAVLREATTGKGSMSQRELSRRAHQSRDCVYDILVGRNKNPTISVLASLAEALGGDLSMFGSAGQANTGRDSLPSEQELYESLVRMLPGMPRGALDKRARYLAEAVADDLRLPRSLPASELDQPDAGREAGVPAP